MSVYGATKAAVNHFADSLRAEASAQQAPLDVLSITPGYVASGNTPRWTGQQSGFASPESVAEAGLLLLPTATTATMSPLLSDLLGVALGVLLLPRRALASIVYARHAAQREELLALPKKAR